MSSISAFPQISVTNLNGDELTLPNGEAVTLVLSFYKEQYPQVLNAVKQDKNLINAPVISKRFLLMKDSLLMGLNDHFGGVKEQTYPLFVDRLSFFKDIGIKEEVTPLLLHIKQNGNFEIEVLK